MPRRDEDGSDDENLEIDLTNMPEEGDDQEIEVSGEEDSEPDAEQAAAAPAKPSRKERRGNRVNELLEAERRRADAAEARHAEVMRTMQQVAQRPVYAQPAQQPQGPDQWEVEAQNLQSQQEYLTAAFQRAHAEGNTAEVQRLQAEGWKLRRAMDRNTYIRNVRELGVPQQPQQPGMTPQQIEHMVEAAAVRRRMNEEHGDIIGNERAARVFEANFKKMIHMGRADDWRTLTAAAEQTRQELRMQPRGGRGAPSEATRARLSGMSTGASGSGASGPRVIKMNKKARLMADATYPHLPEAQRYQKWAREVGAKVPEGA